MIAWRPRTFSGEGAPPEPATEPAAPGEIASCDELYVTGLHLEQYRHATRSPEPYWAEALRRDPYDARCAVALAARRHRAGEYAEAERLLRRAVKRQTRLNPNPYDGEAHYRLGLALIRLDRHAEAYDALAKAAWNAAWRAPAHLAMARLDCRESRWPAALSHLDAALSAESALLQAHDLRVLVLRRLGREEEAETGLAAVRRLDPLDWQTRDLAGLPLDCDTQTCVDVALDYAAAGFTREALRVLDRATERLTTESEVGGPIARATGVGEVGGWSWSGAGPLIGYHRAALLAGLGDEEGARRAAAGGARGRSSVLLPEPAGGRGRARCRARSESLGRAGGGVAGALAVPPSPVRRGGRALAAGRRVRPVRRRRLAQSRGRRVQRPGRSGRGRRLLRPRPRARAGGRAALV